MAEVNKIPIEPQTTVREARKLLGRKFSHLSDDQVQAIINELTLLARKALGL